MYYVGLLFLILSSLVFPLALALYIIKTDKRYLKVVLIGALTFFVSQMVFRIPLLQILLPNMTWYVKMTVAQPILYAFFLSFTAGVFEEVGRYISIRVFLKKEVGVKNAIPFGIGHAGIEAILLVGINTIFMLFVPMTSIAPSMMLASGIERLSAMALHITCSVMVMKAVDSKKLIWLFIALTSHTFFNFIAVYMAQAGSSIWIIESTLFLLAIFGLLFVRSQYLKEKELS